MKIRNLLILVMTFFSTMSFCVTNETLTTCYKRYPFFQEVLMGISDKDFVDAKKAEERRSHLQAQIQKSPQEIRSCLDNIIEFAKSSNDQDNIEYVIRRTKDISKIVYQANGQSVKPKNKRGSR